jgi:hypothetical protein
MDLYNIMLNDVLFGGPENAKAIAETTASTLAGADTLTMLGATLGSYLFGPVAKAFLPSNVMQLVQQMRVLSGWVTPGEGQADIWPGRRHPLPVSAFRWTLGLMVPAVSGGRAGRGVGRRQSASVLTSRANLVERLGAEG